MVKKYSVIDIETTGGRNQGNKITEIAIINIDGDKVVEKFSSLINPEIRIPFNITRLTGISNDMVADAPKFYEIAKKIVEMTEDRIFVAHNVFFDYNFIKHEFSELGFIFRRDKLCTVRLARKYLPGHKSYSLGKICNDLGITNEARHRAMGDAKATVELFNLINHKIQDDDLVQKVSKKQTLPPMLNEEDFKKLPELVGIYYFYDRHGELVYIGKSKNIKKRVSQHFRPDMKRTKDINLKNSIANIEFKLMGSELAALLYECHEIKTYFPKYNHSMKRRKFPYAIDLFESKNGCLRLKMVTCKTKSYFHYAFKNRKRAQWKIESIYKKLIGPFSTDFECEEKLEKLSDSLGTEKFNEMLRKIFYFKLPKDKDFIIPFKGPGFLKGEIEIVERVPKEIRYNDENGIFESLNLISDPDMIYILNNYLYSN